MLLLLAIICTLFRVVWTTIKGLVVAIPAGTVIAIVALLIPLEDNQIRRVREADAVVRDVDPQDQNQNWHTVREAMEYLNSESDGRICEGWVKWSSGVLGNSRECLIPRRSKTRFTDYEMTGYILAGAKLRGAILDGAILVGADLSGARLDGANLERTILRGAVLRDTTLSGADLAYAVLLGANLSGADLHGVRNLAQEQLDEACADYEHMPKNVPAGRAWNGRVCGR